MTQTTAYDIAGSFIRALGGKDTPDMRKAVTIWLTFESSKTVIGNNPWNLHVGQPCKSDSGYCPIDNSQMFGLIGNRYAGKGDQNVAVFSTIDAGTKAAAQNLIGLSPQYGYGNVIKAARSGNAVGFLTALQNSGWSAGHYGYSKLVNSYNSGGGKNYTVNLVAPNTSSTSVAPKPVSTGATGSTGNSTGQTPNATLADFNPIGDVAGAIQKTGTWFAFFMLGLLLIGGGILLLTKGPAEKTAQTVGPIAAMA